MFVNITDTDGVTRLVNVAHIVQVTACKTDIEKGDDYVEIDATCIDLVNNDSFTSPMTMAVIESLVRTALRPF